MLWWIWGMIRGNYIWSFREFGFLGRYIWLFLIIFGQFRGVWPGLSGFARVFGWFPGVWPGFRSFLASFGVFGRGCPGLPGFLAGFLVFGQVFDHFWPVSGCLTGVDRVCQGFWLVFWCLARFSIIFGQFRGV
jgi:hypothetical protein